MAFDAATYDPDSPIDPHPISFVRGKPQPARKGQPATEPQEITLDRFHAHQAAPLYMRAKRMRVMVIDLNIYPRSTPNNKGLYYDRRTKKRMGHLYYILEDEQGNDLAAFHGLPTDDDGIPTNFGKAFHVISPWIFTPQADALRDSLSRDFGTEQIASYDLPDDMEQKAAGAQALATMCGATERAKLKYGTSGLAIVFEAVMLMPGIRNINNIVEPLSNIATRQMRGMGKVGLEIFAAAAAVAGFNAIVDPHSRPLANSNSVFVESLRAMCGGDHDLTFMKRVMTDVAHFMHENNFAAPGSELDVARLIMSHRLASRMGAFAISDTMDEVLGEGVTERIGNAAAGVAALGLAAASPQLSPTLRHMLDVLYTQASNPWLVSESLRGLAEGAVQPVVVAKDQPARITLVAAIAATLAGVSFSKQAPAPQAAAARRHAAVIASRQRPEQLDDVA